MKTAISIPDEVFDEAERLAARKKVSRSELFRNAMIEYLNRHSGSRVTEAMNRTIRDLEGETDDFAPTAGRRMLSRSEW
jgi:metal-responsive CopG/Arc/MetJ family transcriptional regulator